MSCGHLEKLLLENRQKPRWTWQALSKDMLAWDCGNKGQCGTVIASIVVGKSSLWPHIINRRETCWFLLIQYGRMYPQAICALACFYFLRPLGSIFKNVSWYIWGERAHAICPHSLERNTDTFLGNLVFRLWRFTQWDPRCELMQNKQFKLKRNKWILDGKMRNFYCGKTSTVKLRCHPDPCTS